MPGRYNRPMRPFKTIALAGKYNSHEISGALLQLAAFLKQAGYEIIIATMTAERIGSTGYPVADLSDIGQRADLVIIFGGDGTMLNIARALIAFDIPLVGINQGRVGFLTDLSVSDMVESLTRILAGEYESEQRFMARATVQREGLIVSEACAFNDIVISKGATGRLIEMEVFIDDEFVYSQRSDGIVIATPTGSTAYALSSGGPILHPTLEALVIVPVCPHTLSNRPIAVGSHFVIDIVVTDAQDAAVHFDGQTRFGLKEKDKVSVRRSKNDIRLLHPTGYSYYNMLRQKLRWGEKL